LRDRRVGGSLKRCLHRTRGSDTKWMRWHNWKTVRDCRFTQTTSRRFHLRTEGLSRHSIITLKCKTYWQRYLRKTNSILLLFQKLLNYLPFLKDSCQVVKPDSTGWSTWLWKRIAPVRRSDRNPAFRWSSSHFLRRELLQPHFRLHLIFTWLRTWRAHRGWRSRTP
jgi:hypothetical protein